MRCTVVALLMSCAIPAIGTAQTPFFHQGLDRLHPPDSVLPNEQVDPASGSLTVISTDLVLPGNAGFNLTIQRVYNSAIFPNYASGSTDVEERSWAGVGWKLHFGRILHADSEASGQMSVEMGDGSRHPLYHSINNPNVWTTADFWLYNPATGVLQLPNGQVYTFGREVFLNDQLGEVLYVTQVTDPYGNAITFNYFTDPSAPPDGVASIHQTLSASESRDVTFTYDSTFHALASMTYLNHTWVYTQSGSGPDGDPLLVQVTPPQGPSTVYDYGGAALNGEINAIHAPFGGTIAYTYQDATRVASTFTTKTRVVATRTISGHGVTTGTWMFAYGTGTNQDTTVITCGCGGTTSYRFDGIGLSGDFSAWHAGTLAEVTVVDGSTTLEDRLLTWGPSDPISSDPVSGPSGIWSDSAVYRPLLQTISTTRNGHTWSTTYQYHQGDGSLNDFGQPYQIQQEGETIYQMRTTTRTFQTGFTPYMAEKISSETVAEQSSSSTSDGSISSSFSYDPATGFLTAQMIRGIQTTFEERTDGNVNAAIDGDNNRTVFGYDWGLVSSIQTPNSLTTYTIFPEGLIHTVTQGDTTTTLGFDLALRLNSIQTSGMSANTYGYDDLHGTWVKEFRGSSTIEHDVDGFGREILTFNSVGVQIYTTRDACGRVTQVSEPYTNQTPAYSATSYDALGRVTQIIDPARGTTQFTYAGANVTRTDPNNHTTTLQYMVFGDPAISHLTGVVDAAGNQTLYQYDVSGVLTQVRGPGIGTNYSPLPRNWTVTNGLVTSEAQPESGTTTYVYDAAGNLKTITDANNQTTQFTYDGENRLINRDAPGAVDDLAITYDATGRVHTLAGGGTTTTFTYDVSNRTVTRSDATSLGTFASTYQNDANDNLSAITYPSGRVVNYSYDAENRLSAVNYTAPGSSTSSPFAGSFTYGDDGRIASYVTGVVTHQFTYSAGRLQHVFTTGGTGVLDLAYGYDPAGNVASITDPRPAASQTFAIDALDRLTTATGPWGTLQWTYDSAGNRLSEVSSAGTTNYSYNTATQRLDGTTGYQSELFSYDNVGQLTGDALIGSYTYSPTGKLLSATGSGLTVNYSYDAAGDRLSSSTGGQTLYTLRGISGETLSEYLNSCGSAVWTRDLIYAGGQLLGAAKAAATSASVTMQASAVNVAEAAGNATATVRLTTPGSVLGCPVTVSYQTVAGTATAGADYTTESGTLTFASGSPNGATQTIAVPIINDTINEPTETFNINLTAVQGATLGATAQTTVSILDDDPPPTIHISNVTANEGNSGTTPFQFVVALSQPSGYAVQVSYATADGTATAVSDYQSTSGTLTIPAGITATSITVPVYGDTIYEHDETFTVNLSSPIHATLANSQGVGTILNDDPPRKTWGDLYVPRDGQADGAMINPSTNVWTFRDSYSGAVQTFGPFGNLAAGDIPVAADYNGDGITDCAVFRPSTGVWTIALSCNAANVYTQSWGGDPSDVPVPADYDGDGKADLAVYRASTGYWYVLYSSGIGSLSYQWGWTWTTTLPVPGDYDGDGKADLAYYAQYNSSWWIMQSSTWTLAPVVTNNLGNVPVIAVPGDYDGDGKTDCAVFNPADGMWIVVSSATGATTETYYGTASGVVPVPADYDGDGKRDLAVYYPPTRVLYFLQSSTGASTAVDLSGMTQPGDVPVLQWPQ